MPGHQPDGRPVPFVGRSEELHRLATAWDATTTGGGPVVVVIEGEAGIGKTRLVEEAVTAIRASAGQPFVARVTCSELPLARLQPVADLAAQLLDAAGDPLEELAVVFGASSTDDASWLAPALEERLRDVAEPFVLLVDDLQWAGVDALAVLRSLLQHVNDLSMLVVAVARDDCAAPGVAALIDDLLRWPRSAHLRLAGLSRGEVREALRGSAHCGIPDEQVDEVFRRTDGNPLLTVELAAELLRHDPAGPSVPRRVRAAVADRLERLGLRSARLVELMAASGGPCSAGLLVDASGSTALDVLDSLAEAEREGLIGAADGGTFRFRHDLLREAVWTGVPTGRRLAMHHDLGLALEQRGVAEHLPELARHFGALAHAGEADRALRYARDAALAAASVGAHSEAEAHLRVALHADAALPCDPARTAELRLALAVARREQGDPTFRPELEAIARDAERRGDDATLARAVLALNQHGLQTSGPYLDDELLDLLRRAVARAHDLDPALRASLLATLAIESSFEPDPTERLEQAARAVELAESSQDAAARAFALRSRFMVVHKDDAPLGEQEELLDRLRLVARTGGDLRSQVAEQLFRFVVRLVRGELTEAARCLDGAEELLTRAPNPAQQWLVQVRRAAIALASAPVAEAESLVDAATHAGAETALEPRHLLTVAGGQLFALRWRQGRLAELEAVARKALARQPEFEQLPISLAVLLVEDGRPEEAAGILERFRPQGFALPANGLRLAGWVQLAHVAAAVGDAEAGAALDEHLRPYAGRWTWNTSATFGPVEYGLAAAASARGDAAAAEDQRRTAEEASTRVGALAIPQLHARAKPATGAGRRVARPVTGIDALTASERRVVELVAQGLTNAEIAAQLVVSRRTVESHVSAAYRKVGVTSRVELALAVLGGDEPAPA